MDAIYNYDCRHTGCQGYEECQVTDQQERRRDFWDRQYRGEGSLRGLGTDPVAALEGDLLAY